MFFSVLFFSLSSYFWTKAKKKLCLFEKKVFCDQERKHQKPISKWKTRKTHCEYETLKNSVVNQKQSDIFFLVFFRKCIIKTIKEANVSRHIIRSGMCKLIISFLWRFYMFLSKFHTWKWLRQPRQQLNAISKKLCVNWVVDDQKIREKWCCCVIWPIEYESINVVRIYQIHWFSV